MIVLIYFIWIDLPPIQLHFHNRKSGLEFQLFSRYPGQVEEYESELSAIIHSITFVLPVFLVIAIRLLTDSGTINPFSV